MRLLPARAIPRNLGHRSLPLLLLLSLGLSGARGCSPSTLPETDASGEAARVDGAPAPPPGLDLAVGRALERSRNAALDPRRLHALLLNGGERRAVNYRSHLEHLRELLSLLRAARVPHEQIHIFASDGPDPAPDLAVRDARPQGDFWLLPRSGVGEHLRPRIEYVNSTLEGFDLEPATHAALEAWFGEQGARLGPGDVLLLYVTDHGRKNEEDLSDNTISLWGEALSVRELQRLLDALHPAVRVVMVMSQCFGGSFAYAIFTPEDPGALRGNVCGYFATTPDRLAFGCYPEKSAEADVGHSHRLFEALRTLGSLPPAHLRTLVTDRTPDVPHTSSDFYLEQRLEEEAARTGRSFEAQVDALLAEAWRNRAAFEPEIRLLDRVAHSFGLFSPRTLAELDAQTAGLPELGERLKTYADRWKDALEAAKRENWRRFLETHPEWRPRFETSALRALDAEGRAALAHELLPELARFTHEDPETRERLFELRRRAEDAREAHYRSEVRLGAVRRMRILLTSVAGRVWLENGGSPDAAADLDRLERCEALSLGPPAPVLALEDPPPLPPLAEDRRLIESVMPSWMGIRYRQVPPRRRTALGLPRGAAAVITVYPDSPAEEAGIQVGDMILGTPGEPFEEPHAVREWIMRSQLGRPTTLEVLRDGERIELTLVPGPFPLEMPELPGPPKLGSQAPPLQVTALRGDPDAVRGDRLLFFWATWCGPCKQSLPELLAFAAERDVEVVAITDEHPEDVEAFLRDFAQPFPEIVAVDPRRASFQSYGVSGTPTFVLVDAGGIVRHVQRGYRPGVGLEIEGWSYTRSSR